MIPTATSLHQNQFRRQDLQAAAATHRSARRTARPVVGPAISATRGWVTSLRRDRTAAAPAPVPASRPLASRPLATRPSGC